MLNRDSALPRYVLIAERIRREIACGTLKQGDKLPSQRELAETFSTTVMTVRQALALLEEESLIHTLHGVGSFVKNPVLEVDCYPLQSFGEEMSQQSLKIETILLEVQTAAQNRTAARALSLHPEVPLCKISRLRLLEGLPIVYQSSFLPPWLAQVVESYSPQQGLYEFLFRQAGQIASMAKEVLNPTNLNAEQASWLKRPIGQAAFLSLRLSTNPEGAPLIYDEAIMAGDRFVLLVERIGQRTTSQVRLLSQQPPNWLSLLLDEEIG